ncbi:hypothetical protein HYH02_008016 [Chlamydomonas schloesseri]|uniref:Uncharacterized protein n=1 Tax=Chlamydomonas schloesseri TaxID=2026947 RepID=A0A836B4A4_9CHLO|nr:hypothetical protein HYH02_008016 [Chlamydomonas schloesseri]|eukprot:KAG2446859.1 hypothetical protein HYH02_008016 [Chlamydomonas schloesseri]
MKADLERLRAKSGSSSAAGPSSQPQASQVEAGGSFTGAKDALDKLLIADFFLVLFILAWLAAGVAQNAVSGSSPLLDAWYPLWPLLWQPALGVLMAGALVSGGIGWLNEQAAKRGQQ